MKPTVLILAAAWILSLGAAYLVGSGNSKPLHNDPSGSASRSQARPGSSSAKSERGSQSSRAARSARAESGGRAASRLVAGLTPREAVVELAQLTDPVERAKGFLALLDSLAPGDFRDVVADFRGLGITEQRMSEYGMLLHAWGQVAPQDALDYAMTETGTPFARQTILASWASNDPEAAIAFAKENHEGDQANPLLVGVIRGIAHSDLGRATELLQDLPFSRERGDALQSVLPFVMENGIEIALTWTNGISDERLRTGAISYIVTDLSESQPEAAAKILVGLDDQAAAVRVADDVAGSLARQDLDLAITWTEDLQPDLRAEAVEGIMSTYASRDPQAAAQWLDSLAGTTNLDAGIRSFAWNAQRSEPQLAADWIGRISSERDRNELYRGVLSRWLGNDPAAAEQWIQSTPDLPESVQQLPARMRERTGDPRRTR